MELPVLGNVVEPLRQTYSEPPPLAFNVCVDEPQINVLPSFAEIVGAANVGDMLSSTVLLVEVQPDTGFVVLTVYLKIPGELTSFPVAVIEFVEPAIFAPSLFQV